MTASAPRLRALSMQVATLLVLLAVWQGAATAVPSPALPPPAAVARTYWRLVQGDLFASAVLPSLSRLVVGFAIAAASGSVLGLAIGCSRELDAWFRPVIEYLRYIPAIAILPPALLIMGPTDAMRIFVIAFGCFFPVVVAAIDAARRVEPLLLETARICGLGPAERIRRVVLFAAMPSLFAGLRIALGLGLIMMTISELIAADDGIGFYILRSQRLFQSAGVYAGVLAIGTMGLILTSGMLAVERRVLHWHRGWRGLAAD